MKECLLCKIYRDKKGHNPANQVVYSGKNFYIRFDDVPVSPGHLEIVANRHITSLNDLRSGEWRELEKLLKRGRRIIESHNLMSLYKNFLAAATNKTFEQYARQMLKSKFLGKKPVGYNIGVNEGEAAGQTIQHLHIHIIPRYKGDVSDPTGGVRNVIPKLGNYKLKLIK